MEFDVVIIGGGLSGLVCGLKVAAAGKSCAIVSSGHSALSFFSGSFDLLGNSGGTDTTFAAIKKLTEGNPGHPYSKIGAENVIKLADEAIYLERVLCQEAGGWQDQIAAAYGGFNRIDFGPDGYEVQPVIISPERKKQLNNNLMMFFTGFTRFSSDVQKANAAGGKDKKAQLKEMCALVDEAEKVLTNKAADLDDFGRLLDHTWKLKRQTGAAVTTDSIDGLYAKGVAAGALGGKLLGAGGGGFLVFYVQPEKQDAVRRAMQDLMHIPFAFENGGTRVIHYTPESYEPKK